MDHPGRDLLVAVSPLFHVAGPAAVHVEDVGVAQFPGGGEVPALRYPAAVDRNQPGGK